MNKDLISRLKDRAEFLRVLGNDDIAALLEEARAAIEAQSVPAGWRLVPMEPTAEMLAAVVTSMDDFLLGKDAEQQYRDDWAAMLAAAPQPAIETQSAPAGANLLGEIVGCFDAAIAEGLFEAIDTTTDERLKDLLQRRIMHAYTAAIGPSKAAPQPAQPAQPEQDRCKDLADLGWQAIECPACGSSARGYPRPAQPVQPLTVEQIWENDAIMSLNADAGLSLTMLEKIVRIIEAAHNITKGTT